MDVKFNIIIIIFLFIPKIESKAYLKMHVYKANDCLNKVYKQDKTLYDYNAVCQLSYQKNISIVSNEIYKFGDIIYFIIHDNEGSGSGSSFI